MSYNPWASEKKKFLILGISDSNLILNVLQRANIQVWNDQIKGYDTVKVREDVMKCSFQNGEFVVDEELVAYSGTEYGSGVVVGIKLNENILENRTLGQIRNEAVQIMREHGSYVMPTDLSIMYGECSE